MTELEIDRIQVYAVGPETPRYAWAEGMNEQFMTNNIVRLTTSDGLEGIGAAASYSEGGFDRAVAETLRHLSPRLLGASAHDREALWHRLRQSTTSHKRRRRSQRSISRSGIWLRRRRNCRSIACWVVAALASSPMLARRCCKSIEAYLEFVEELRQAGFRAVKFHSWCRPKQDLALAAGGA